MDDSEKKKLSEIDICDLFITPAIRDSGWAPETQIRREVTLAPGLAARFAPNGGLGLDLSLGALSLAIVFLAGWRFAPRAVAIVHG